MNECLKYCFLWTSRCLNETFLPSVSAPNIMKGFLGLLKFLEYKCYKNELKMVSSFKVYYLRSSLTCFINHFQALWLLFEQLNKLKLYFLPPQQIGGICVDLTTNSNYFPMQHKLICLYTWDGVFTARYGLDHYVNFRWLNLKWLKIS
jgi:hypothetical protein